MKQILSEDLKQLQQYYFKKPIKKEAFQLLSGGHSFVRNYRLNHEGKIYLARFMPIIDPELLANCEKECRITTYAGEIGIGPKVYYQNPQQGILLTEFIQGRTASSDDMVNDPNRSLIIANIKKLHQTVHLAFPKARLISSDIQEILKTVDSAILQQLLQELELTEPLNHLFHYEENNLTEAFIHGDFNPNNIIIHKSRVYFIDWTDAGIGDPFADISWHALCFPFSSHQQLLRYYFGDIDMLMQQKLLCYYCLRLFLRFAWCVGRAKKLSKDYERLLMEIINQQNLPKPYNLLMDLFTKKIKLDKPCDLCLISASVLQFLSRLTKTDNFLAAIEALT